MSPSTNCSRNHRAPHCHGRCRSLTRNDATIMRTRLCMKPVWANWRIPASTIGEPGAAGLPCVEQRQGVLALVDLNLVERLVPVPPCAVGPLIEHRGVEVAERELAQIGRSARALAEVGGHRAWVDGAELQVRRHPAGAVEVGPVAVLVVVGESVPNKLLPLTPGCGFPGGQLQLDPGVGNGHAAGDLFGIYPLRRFRAGGRRRPPAVLAPRAVEGGEDLVGRAVVLGDPAGRYQVGRSRLLQRHITERVANRVVAASAERRVVRGHVHRCCADRLGQRWNSLLWTAPGHLQAAVEAVAQVSQCVVEILQPTRPRRRLEPGVQDVAGEYVAVGACSVKQWRQVVKSQIAPEPQQSGHAIDAARISR